MNKGFLAIDALVTIGILIIFIIGIMSLTHNNTAVFDHNRRICAAEQTVHSRLETLRSLEWSQWQNLSNEVLCENPKVTCTYALEETLYDTVCLNVYCQIDLQEDIYNWNFKLEKKK